MHKSKQIHKSAALGLTTLAAAIAASAILPALPTQAEDKKVVKIGYYENENFQAGAGEDKIKTGYSYEYMRRLQTYTNWDYEYVYGEYGDLYDKLVAGDIDILTGLAYREERTDIIGYPDLAMGDTPYFFVKRTDETDITSNPSSFEGKTIGVIDGAMKSATENFLTENKINADLVLFDDLEKRDQALIDGEVDLTIVEGNGTDAEKGIETVLQAGESDYYVCTNIRRPDILEDLNLAQAELFEAYPDFKSSLYSKWFRSNVKSSTLSIKEQEWVESHPSVTIAYYNDYLPYSATDENGQATGIVTDVTQEIFDALGIDDIEIKYQGYDTYEEILAAMQAGEADAAFPTLANYWASEGNGLMPSDAVYASYFNLIYNGAYPDMATAKIGIVGGNAFTREFASVEFPSCEYISYESVEAALDAVVNGDVDVTLINGLRTSFYLREKTSYKALTTAHYAGDASMGYATLVDDHETLDILNHGINLTDPDFALTQTYKYEIQYKMTIWDFLRDFWWIPAIIIFLFGALILSFHSRQLTRDRRYLAEEKRQQEERRAEVDIIQSLVSIYFAALEIEIATGKIRVIRIPDFMKERFRVDGTTFNQIKESFVQMCVADSFQDTVRDFLDYDVIKERLLEEDFLQKNYIGRTEGWCRITMVPIRDSATQEISKMVFAVASVNEEKTREESIKYKAEHDELTGCLNRTAYTRIEKDYSTNDQPMGVMIMDVDKFKDVNDTYGHDVGDAVLKNVAQILESSFRKNDYVIRFGGDEFVIIFPECGPGFEARVKDKIRNINEVLLHPTIDGMPPVSVSAGVTIFEGNYSEVILKEADRALYQTKQNGRAGCTVYQTTGTGTRD